MARVLVTGGEGFLGAPLASRAVAGHEAISADVLPTVTRRLDTSDTDAIVALAGRSASTWRRR